MENRAGVSKAKHLLLIEVHPGSSWRHCNCNCFYENSVNSHVVNFKQSLGDQPPLIQAKDTVISMTEMKVLLSFFQKIKARYLIRMLKLVENHINFEFGSRGENGALTVISLQKDDLEFPR